LKPPPVVDASRKPGGAGPANTVADEISTLAARIRIVFLRKTVINGLPGASLKQWVRGRGFLEKAMVITATDLDKGECAVERVPPGVAAESALTSTTEFFCVMTRSFKFRSLPCVVL
jgi:hypothetical protein